MDRTKNPLIADFDSDTCGNVLAVIRYLSWVDCQKNPSTISDEGQQGRALILFAVDDALSALRARMVEVGKDGRHG